MGQTTETITGGGCTCVSFFPSKKLLSTLAKTVHIRCIVRGRGSRRGARDGGTKRGHEGHFA